MATSTDHPDWRFGDVIHDDDLDHRAMVVGWEGGVPTIVYLRGYRPGLITRWWLDWRCWIKHEPEADA